MKLYLSGAGSLRGFAKAWDDVSPVLGVA